MKDHISIFPVEKMAIVLKVSSSGFYKWLTRPKSNRTLRTEVLSGQIKLEYEKSCQIYGSPRITKELHKLNYKVSRSYVARVMKRLNIRSKTRKRYKLTTDSCHHYPVAVNLLKRDFSVSGLSQKWVGDITYIRTGSGWLYLTTVIDVADRKVIGWAFSNDMSTTNTTVKAVKMAVQTRGVKSGLIFHSDRGIQYACDEFKLLLDKHSITQSMRVVKAIAGIMVSLKVFSKLLKQSLYTTDNLSTERSQDDKSLVISKAFTTLKESILPLVIKH